MLLPDDEPKPANVAEKNRNDHRHHAIDAFVIAMTTPGLLSQIAHAASQAEEAGLERLLERVPEPWPGFRAELKSKLTGVVISHKPDHGRKGLPPKGRDATAGRLHNDTAYGLTGDVAADGKTPIVVHRVPLTSLKPADISNSERIPDPVLRAELHRATDGLSGKDYERALARFAAEHPQFKGIRRVRVREPLNVIPIRDRKNGHAYKAYKGDANARFELWRLPDGKLKTDVVSMFEAHQLGTTDRRPHPAAKRLLMLRQNDLLAIERNGSPTQIVRVVGFNAAGRLTLADHNEGGNLKERDSAAQDLDPFKYIYLSGSSILKAKARQVRIDPLGRIFDPGPR